ncbi:recombinase family protein [Paenibacillus sp. RUD330]|uniref:recombinase family protein n=1 Tax=Paenibacillus sp. RUD330 TaxID=2023772 RepID=UPI000B929346|nr:recombinase family protein [Paenibacillus sp. RUD330]ASS66569.1 recombinase family protein [Paenibacillus sp. RUD330]
MVVRASKGIEAPVRQKVALYIRVSSEEQAVSGFGLDVQRERLTAFAKSQGWDDVELYMDDGYTGTNTNRPALKRLIRHVEAGKIHTVVVYKLDRLGRKQKDVLELLEDVFEKNGVAFKSATEPFDTSTPLGKAMLGILAVFGQLERDMIIERTTSGRRERVNQGMWHGGRIPFGYHWNKEAKELEIKPDEAAIIREIYKRFLQGQSRLAIAEWAQSRTTARKMTHTDIRDILVRPLYAGKLLNAGLIVEGNHDAIIDEDTWNMVQAENVRRKEGATPVGEYLLTGLLQCGICGGPVVHVKRRTKRNGKDYLYELYACQKQHIRTKDRAASCKNKYHNRAKVEAFVIEDIRNLSLLDPKRLDAILEQQTNTQDSTDTRNALQHRLETIETGIENLYDAIQSGAVKASALGNRITRLEEERESVQLQLDDLDDAPEIKNTAAARKMLQDLHKMWDFLTEEEQKQLIRKVVTRVVLHSDSSPEIVLNLAK